MPPPIISADDHIDLGTLPGDLWQSRLPASLRETGPRVVQGTDGPEWVCAGESWGASGPKRVGALLRAGVPDPGSRPISPRLRLEDMDRDGVQAHVIYGAIGSLPIADPSLKTACLQAYNDWTAEYDSSAPGRLCNLALLPNHGAHAAAAELRRAAGLGHRGALFDHFASAVPVHAPAWDPLWAAAEETGLPISVHLIAGAYSLQERVGTWEMPAFVSIAPLQLDEVLSGMCFSGTLERHPNLRLVLGEAGLGWVPYLLQRMEEEFQAYHGVLSEHGVTMSPKDLFSRQVLVTFERDALGVKLLPEIGEDNVMWASDYPHLDSTWPNSAAFVEDTFSGLGAPIRERVLWRNAAELYGLA